MDSTLKIDGQETFIKTTYNGIEIIARKSDQYVNASKLVMILKNNNRSYLSKLFNTKNWQEYYSHFVLNYQNNRGGENSPSTFMETIETYASEYRGTWIHPKLINYIAIWASPKYASTVGEIMDKINETVIAEHEADKTQAIADQFHYVINTVTDTLSDRITDLNQQVRQLVPRAVPNGKERTYILIVEEVNEDEQLEEQQEDHITIRIRRINRKDLRTAKIERYRRESLLFVDNLPIAMTINEKIKETLQQRQDVKIWSTHYTFPEDQLDFIIDIIQATINTERAH
ncbi:MAG: hypothetical protein EZS28_044123 [Streblomastix strix]|uniref:KilA-N domain-containing protein n=1 Tax=Streblomastix strix TaxID=222440 RepID=A0A5J4TQY0_9EUKA|nr:MAG: hypothetical protein EZS28_044123 [Streblomastix strix]